MSVLNKKRLYSLLAALLVCSASSSAWARPNMWWDHFESATPNQTECVKQAETILNAEKVGQLTSDADSVRAWSEKSTAVAECIQFGDKLIVAVIVSSDDPVAGNTVFNALRAALMKK
ncbi:hypothetical protein [Methylococcus sp. EFPC2]|uniref:hypothetical protein n=1 Tax=Methylococcus sp. EFPC2 TaxID=2812648 RepID=UPI00196835DA|nr:hypothetical protein [Methylococcus sp. EFPC2]QSA97015.1 hypothetical protein JWZ97_17715 [Methylococcus sp. EFPC2]